MNNILASCLVTYTCQAVSPSSGYLTRQISFVLNNFIFKDGEDEDNPGLLIPRYKALGRTAPNGKIYSEKPLVKGSEDDLVPVRSIVTKRSGDLNVVSPDLIGTKFKDLTEGTAIGLSFSTSFTEGITQAILGLKHGGHERVLETSGYLVAPKPCEFREEGKWIILKTKSGELKYPRPENLVTLGKTKFEKGENVCVAYTTNSPANKPNSVIKLIRAKASEGTRFYEKDDIIISDCYAFADGIIHYVEDKFGDIEVWVGDRRYDYNPRCMYYYPDGTEIKKFQRICSGVVNMDHVSSAFGSNINDTYLIFRKQFYTLTDSEFLKTGVSSLNSTQEEIIELLFKGITQITYDPKKLAIQEVQYLGTGTSILSKKSFYTVLSYGYSSKVVAKALKGEVNLSDDVMSDTVLGLLLKDKLDDKN